MNRFFHCIAVLAILLPSTAPASDLLSPAAADRLGLVEAWHRQLGTVGGARSIVDVRVWVQQNTTHEYVNVVAANPPSTDASATPATASSTTVQFPSGQILRRIATDTKNDYGQEIGLKEAERLARMDVLKLKRRGISAEVTTTKTREVRIYMLGDDGGLSAYDAETGETIWNLRIGQPSLGYGLLGISDEYVTVINGMTMYRIIADNREMPASVAEGGRPLPEVRLDSVPVLGATNTPSFVAVPNTRGGVECYSYDPSPLEPSVEIFTGQAVAKPVRFPLSSKIGWTTAKGFFYVMDTDGKPTTQFRLKTDGVSDGGAAAASNDRFFFGCSGGRVYGVRATRVGEVMWNKSLGEPFYNAPFVVKQNVLIASTYGNLFNLDAADGMPIWAAPTSNVESLFAFTGQHFFGKSTAGYLVAIEPASGAKVNLGAKLMIDHVVMNEKTDRLYVISEGGTVQCLRPAEHELPRFWQDSEEPQRTAETIVDKKEKPAAPADADANPFGAPAPAAADDPFGAGDDPFGASDKGAAGDDPFGSADPFGN